MWFVNQRDTTSIAYNIPTVLRITGDLDAGALHRRSSTWSCGTGAALPSRRTGCAVPADRCGIDGAAGSSTGRYRTRPRTWKVLSPLGLTSRTSGPSGSGSSPPHRANISGRDRPPHRLRRRVGDPDADRSDHRITLRKTPGTHRCSGRWRSSTPTSPSGSMSTWAARRSRLGGRPPIGLHWREQPPVFPTSSRSRRIVRVRRERADAALRSGSPFPPPPPASTRYRRRPASPRSWSCTPRSRCCWRGCRRPPTSRSAHRSADADRRGSTHHRYVRQHAHPADGVEPGASFEQILVQAKSVDLDAFANADIPFDEVVEACNVVRSDAFALFTQVWLTFEQTACPNWPDRTSRSAMSPACASSRWPPARYRHASTCWSRCPGTKTPGTRQPTGPIPRSSTRQTCSTSRPSNPLPETCCGSSTPDSR